MTVTIIFVTKSLSQSNTSDILLLNNLVFIHKENVFREIVTENIDRKTLKMSSTRRRKGLYNVGCRIVRNEFHN